MKLRQKRMGMDTEEFWFDSLGYLNSTSALVSLRTFDVIEKYDCRILETTLIVSLQGEESDWLNRFSARTRASIRLGEKSCQITRATSEADQIDFFEAQKHFAKSAGIAPPQKVEREKLEIFLARNSSGDLLHGCAFLYFEEIGLYRYRYSVAVQKSQLNVTLLFAAMKFAKSLGCNRFDLGGIIPDANEGSKEERIRFFKSQFAGKDTSVFFYMRSPYFIFSWALKVLSPLLMNHKSYRWVERFAAKF